MILLRSANFDGGLCWVEGQAGRLGAGRYFVSNAPSIICSSEVIEDGLYVEG